MVDQFMTQGIIENNRETSNKLMGSNSVTWSGKESKKSLLNPLSSQDDSEGSKAVPL